MAMEIKLTTEETQEVIRESLKYWDRPCSECEYHKTGGCSRWDCVEESKVLKEAIAHAEQAKVQEKCFQIGEYYDFGTEDAFGGVFGVSFGYVKVVGRDDNEIFFKDDTGKLHTAITEIGIHDSEMFYPFGNTANAEGKVFKVAADHQRLWSSHSEKLGIVA